jgi:hypothetical protein
MLDDLERCVRKDDIEWFVVVRLDRDIVVRDSQESD